MLKLTKKADYALMAMKHLAEHSSPGLAQREGCRRCLWHPARGPGEDSAAPGQGRSAAVAARHQWRIYAGPRGAHDFGF